MTLRVSTLDNGLRIATDTMEGAQSVLFGAWVGVGTRHEPWSANGVAHLAEHMMFKGTKRRSAFAISADIEKRGGAMNAHTSREETAYYARVLPEDVELAADVIADMLQRSVFDPKELDRERQVIIQEIGRDQDTPEEHITDLLHEAAFPRQKIGRSILGSSAVIANLPRRELMDYVKRHYHAGNMVIVASGKVDHDAVVALARKHFGKLPSGSSVKPGKAVFKSGEIRCVKESEQLHLMLSFKGPSAFSRLTPAASLLGVLLGGSSSSRLFQKVREKRGLVYSVSASHMLFQDVGLFTIYAGTDPERVRELMPVIGRELRDVMEHVTPSEIKLAKAQSRAELLLAQESVARRAENLGTQLLCFGKPLPVERLLEQIERVTKEQVQAMATSLFKKRPTLVALGPHEKLESYDTFVGRLRP